MNTSPKCKFQLLVVAVSIVVAFGFPGAAISDDIQVTLSGDQEVPPVTTSASGSGTITVGSDKSITGSVKTSGVAGTAAHIHEGAPGKSGGVVIPLTKTSDNTFSVPGSAKLTDAQYAAYKAGNLYVNVHSDAHPDGEIRGQLKPMVPISGIDDAVLAASARASKLIGSKIYKGDTSIGQIEDVLVDLNRATVWAVILSVGGFLGIGDKLVAVPVNQIRVGGEAKFTTDLTKEQLSNAPAFDFGKLK